jgi:surface antigen
MPYRRLALPAAIVLALAAGFPGPVQAQINPFRTNRAAPRLDRTDLALLDQAAEKLYTQENVADGASESWDNPRTGASGSVTVVSSFHRTVRGDSLLCRRLRYDVAVRGRNGTRSVLIDWCRLPDGRWKMG